MKAMLAVLVLAALAAATPADTFRAWASAHGKVYTSAERARRASVFAENMRRVEELNAQGHALFGLTKFADLTPAEFRAKYLRAVPPKHHQKVVAGAKVADEIPDAFDWREATDPIMVGDVKDQSVCGSCWAFSAVAYLEGLYAKNNSDHQILSEQQLVDCDHECQEDDPTACDSGCNGGWMITAMTYAIKEGMMHSSDYKYKSIAGKCKYDAQKAFANFEGTAIQLPAGNEELLLSTVYSEGPISVAVHADPWQLYFGGVFDHDSCSKKPDKADHGVAVVGWGHDEQTDKDFWIVRNSWGAYWGEQGYIRVFRGSNMCGIANFATLIQA